MKSLIASLISTFFLCSAYGQQEKLTTVYFEYNQHVLSSEANFILEECLVKLKKADIEKIIIHGHTDAIGSANYNRALSKKRAKTAAEFLIDRGIPSSKIRFQYLGSSQPLGVGDQYQNKNRRVDIFLVRSADEGNNLHTKIPQTFILSPDKDTTIACEEGTLIHISANSFVKVSDDTPITQPVHFKVEEYYKISDLLRAKLSTTSNEQLLETGGMINITATSKNEELQLKKGQSIEISFPTMEKKSDMQLFAGAWQNENWINWELMSNPLLVGTFSGYMPQFPGGGSALKTFIQANANYPEEAIEMGIEGPVYVRLTINEKGEVTNPRIVRSPAPELDAAALNIIQKMPNWIPASKEGLPISTQVTIPIQFYLPETYNGESIKQRAEKYKERFEASYSDTTLQQAKSGQIMYYLLSTTQLGWLNCDRFLKLSPLTSYTIQTNEHTEILYVVFDNYSSLMQSISNNGLYTFQNVPIGEPITIVAIQRKDNNNYLAIKNTQISQQIEMNLDFQPVTIEMLQNELVKLDNKWK